MESLIETEDGQTWTSRSNIQHTTLLSFFNDIFAKSFAHVLNESCFVSVLVGRGPATASEVNSGESLWTSKIEESSYNLVEILRRVDCECGSLEKVIHDLFFVESVDETLVVVSERDRRDLSEEIQE